MGGIRSNNYIWRQVKAEKVKGMLMQSSGMKSMKRCNAGNFLIHWPMIQGMTFKDSGTRFRIIVMKPRIQKVKWIELFADAAYSTIAISR